MCQRLNNALIKSALAIIVAIVAGVVVAVNLFTTFTSPFIFAVIELISSGIALSIFPFLPAFDKNKIDSVTRYYLGFLLAGIIGSFASAILVILTGVSTSLFFYVIFGISVAFFVILLFGVVYYLDRTIRNIGQ